MLTGDEVKNKILTNERTNERTGIIHGKGIYKLFNGDCLEVMKQMPDMSVDVVFTSPPYNDSGRTKNDIKTKRHTKYQTSEFREDWCEWQKECINEMLRISKRQVLYNVQPILSNKADVYRLIGMFSDIIDHILVWYKPNARPQPYPHRIANCYELVLIFKAKQFDTLYINSNGYKNVIVKNINGNHKYSDKHRAVMNMDFCNEIISEFTKENETVLDPFMGLATTGICCLNNKRNFYGIEISKEYFNIGYERLIDETAQMTIFNYL